MQFDTWRRLQLNAHDVHLHHNVSVAERVCHTGGIWDVYTLFRKVVVVLRSMKQIRSLLPSDEVFVRESCAWYFMSPHTDIHTHVHTHHARAGRECDVVLLFR